MMNSRRVFMSQQRAPDPQFLNFLRTRLSSSNSISFPPNLQQNSQYLHLRQLQPPYTDRSRVYGQYGMSGRDEQNQQPKGAFWDKFKDIRKRAQEYKDSEVMRKNMKMDGEDLNSVCEKDPADDYQDRPKWKKTHYGRISGHQKDGHLFSICSYNILAQNLLEMHPDLYAHCRLEYLNWEYRKKNLLRELKNSQADIMCLQEVQEEHFLSIFKPEFRKLGFNCVFKKRTGDKRDGCAIFYRDRSFHLETCRSIEYYHPQVHLLDRDNIGLIVILKSKHVPGKLCIANTHLLFNPRRGDVKLAQLSYLFAEIDKVAYETTENGSGHCPIIICGDFNSEPKSPLCNFIENSFLDYSNMMSGEVCKPYLENTSQRRRGKPLYVPLLPKRLGISESCQYMHVIEQRRALQRTETKGVSLIGDRDSKHIETQDNKDVDNSLKGASGTILVQDEAAKVPSIGTNGNKDTSTSSKETSEDTASGMSFTKDLAARGPLEHPPEDSKQHGACGPSSNNEAARGPSNPFEHPPTGRLHHNLNVESAYLQHDGFVTTHHTKTNCTVDFMFNTRARKDGRIADLKRIAWLPLFTNEDADNMGGLPNKYWSSDHYRLQIKYILRPPCSVKSKKK